MPISKFIDVDFARDKRYVQGYDRKHKPGLCAGAFGDSFDVISESRWKDEAAALASEKAGLSWLIKWILNQGNEGSCVGNAGTQAHQICQARAVGLDRVVQMSAISLYKQIGGGPNTGASVDDAIDRLGDTGLLPLDTPENRARFGSAVMPATGFYSKWPSDWKSTAAKFAGLEGYACRSVAEMVSALLKGMPVHVGRAGHSIVYVEPVYVDGQLCIDYVNSWGDWGFGKGSHDSGFGRDTARYYRESADWCYAYQAVDPSKWDWLFQGAA